MTSVWIPVALISWGFAACVSQTVRSISVFVLFFAFLCLVGAVAR